MTISEVEHLWTGDDFTKCPAYPFFERITKLIDYQNQNWDRPIINLAMRARSIFQNHLDDRSLLTYSTMLSKLRDAIELDPDGLLVHRLRERYDVALVDEFQDTDDAQWTILRTVFQCEDKRESVDYTIHSGPFWSCSYS